MKKRKKIGTKGKKSVAKNKAAATRVPAKRGPGQPTIYTAKIAMEICDRLSKGESLRSICRREEMPAINTVLNWLFDHKHLAFEKDYERAREIQADVIFEETFEIADDSLKIVKNGKVSTANARVNALRLQVDTRKWALARMKPKRYGERVDVTSGGKEIKQPRAVAINYAAPAIPKAA